MSLQRYICSFRQNCANQSRDAKSEMKGMLLEEKTGPTRDGSLVLAASRRRIEGLRPADTEESIFIAMCCNV